MQTQTFFNNYEKWLGDNYKESVIINKNFEKKSLEFIAVFRTFNILYLIIVSLLFTPLWWLIYFVFTWKKEKVKTIATFDNNWKIVSLNHRYNFLKDNYNNQKWFIKKDNSWDLSLTQIIIVTIILVWILYLWMTDKL